MVCDRCKRREDERVDGELRPGGAVLTLTLADDREVDLCGSCRDDYSRFLPRAMWTFLQQPKLKAGKKSNKLIDILVP
jgi:hypothetical protein